MGKLVQIKLAQKHCGTRLGISGLWQLRSGVEGTFEYTVICLAHLGTCPPNARDFVSNRSASASATPGDFGER